MPDSIPVLWRAIVWPLLGAAVTLTVGRLLPGWLRRLLAAAAAAASLATLWSLPGGAPDHVGWLWEPITFFRLGPALRPHPLSLAVGILLAGSTAAGLPGIRGAGRTAWHGLVLIALAGCLLTLLAADLLTLALGSGLLDLALMAMAASAASPSDRIAWRMAVPGAASTLLLFLSAVQMSSQVGTTLLSASAFPVEVLTPLGLAGLLRLMAFPLHPRGLATAEEVVTCVLPTGLGLYLLARVQSLAPLLADRPWLLAVGGMALVAGGVLAWAEGTRLADRSVTGTAVAAGPGPWPGLAVHQAGLALAFVALGANPAPWPLVSLALALTALAIWWDGNLAQKAALWPDWLQPVGRWLAPYWEQARAAVATAVPALERWRSGWSGRHGWALRLRSGQALLPAIALASLAGAPLTAGAIGRWSFYAELLRQQRSTLLIAALLADTFLVAGLWTLLRAFFHQAADRHPRPASLLALLALAVGMLWGGISAGSLGGRLMIEAPVRPAVSVWGLGLLYSLPWLLGLWLAHAGSGLGRFLDLVRDVINLDWLYRVAAWAGRGLAGGLYWLSRVGEGDGWWGWALIILALATIFLTAR